MLARMLRWARDNVRMFRTGFFLFLAVLLLLGGFIKVVHPHFDAERMPAFWAGFGLGGSVVMTLVLKKLVLHIIGRREDFYDR